MWRAGFEKKQKIRETAPIPFGGGGTAGGALSFAEWGALPGGILKTLSSSIYGKGNRKKGKNELRKKVPL